MIVGFCLEILMVPFQTVEYRKTIIFSLKMLRLRSQEAHRKKHRLCRKMAVVLEHIPIPADQRERSEYHQHGSIN